MFNFAEFFAQIFSIFMLLLFYCSTISNFRESKHEISDIAWLGIETFSNLIFTLLFSVLFIP